LQHCTVIYRGVLQASLYTAAPINSSAIQSNTE